MAPARSIQCISRPPSSAASGLASFGSTIAAIADCESRTGRGLSVTSVMGVFPSWQSRLKPLLLGFLFQVVLQETFRHLLDARVVVSPQPDRPRQVEFQIAMLDRSMISLANIA